MGRRRGFTLFEVAIAMLIMSVSIISIVMILLSATQTQQRKRYELFAAAQAVDLLDRFANVPTAFFAARIEGRELVDVPTVRRAHVPDLETAILTVNSNVAPVPTAIARRFDDPEGAIARILDAGGQLYYFTGRTEGGRYTDADRREDQAAAAARVVFAVDGFAQHNALIGHPLIAWPYYHQVPSPPLLQSIQEQSHANDLYLADLWPALWDTQVFRQSSPAVQGALKRFAQAIIHEESYDAGYDGLVSNGGHDSRNLERPGATDRNDRIDDRTARLDEASAPPFQPPVWETYDRPVGVVPEESWKESSGTWSRRSTWPKAIEAIRQWDAVVELCNAVFGTGHATAADFAGEVDGALAVPEVVAAADAPKAVALGYLAFLAVCNQRFSPTLFDQFEASGDPDKFKIHRDNDANGSHWDYTPTAGDIADYHVAADSARALHELALRWHLQWQVQRPYDLRVSRPLNRPLMSDLPLLQFDLMGSPVVDQGSGPGRHPPGLVDGAGSPLERWRSWRVIGEHPFQIGPAGAGHDRYVLPERNLNGMVVGYWHDQFDYGDYDIPDPAGWQGDSTRFDLTDRFAAAERCRQLLFWAVDWQSYEDFESQPADPYDASRAPIVPRRGMSRWHQFDFVSGVSPDVGGGASANEQLSHLSQARVQAPEWAILWNDDTRRDRTPPHWVTQDLPWTQEGTTLARNWRELGRYGADRNANERFDRGPLPATQRVRAEPVGRYLFYDRRLPGSLRQ